jgi:hypothetical protein
MRPTRAKNSAAAAPALPEVSGNDRAVLASAYKAGLILAWKRDVERGYRLSLAGRTDEYIEVAKLTGYLEKLRAAAGALAR